MGWVDLVPRAGNLYIGGLYALYQTDLIRAAGITHVLSVIDYDALLKEKFAHLQHFHIRADDHPNEDLLRWFERGVRYIDGALNGGDEGDGEGKGGEEGGQRERVGGVFVHCAMGKSRSATLVVAYLMWKYHLDPTTALNSFARGGLCAIRIRGSKSSWGFGRGCVRRGVKRRRGGFMRSGRG